MTVRVVDVIDGGAFRASSGGIVRLRNVATPGLMTLAGMQAKSRLEELVLHKHVECDELDTDPDGNVVARVWVDGVDINQVLCPVPAGPRAAQPAPTPAGTFGKVDIRLDESAFRPRDDKEGRA